MKMEGEETGGATMNFEKRPVRIQENEVCSMIPRIKF